jgi:hypothetical protein
MNTRSRESLETSAIHYIWQRKGQGNLSINIANALIAIEANQTSNRRLLDTLSTQPINIK